MAPTPPHARKRPGKAVALLDLPRTLGSAPERPWRSSTSRTRSEAPRKGRGAPAAVRKGPWLGPGTFLAQVRPKLVATVPAPPPAPTVILPAPATLEELRTRSYPSFTRIVLETSGPVVHRVETAGGKEMRIRL